MSMKRTPLAAALLAAAALGACQSAPTTAPARTVAQAPAPAYRAAPVSRTRPIPTASAPVSDVLARAGQQGRPALLYFWANW
jgi:hypothetical protein